MCLDIKVFKSLKTFYSGQANDLSVKLSKFLCWNYLSRVLCYASCRKIVAVPTSSASLFHVLWKNAPELNIKSINVLYTQLAVAMPMLRLQFYTVQDIDVYNCYKIDIIFRRWFSSRCSASRNIVV